MSELERAWKAAGGTVRDRRWERVWASMGTPEYDISEPADDAFYRDVIEIRIELSYDGMFYWQTQLIWKEEVDLANFDILNFILTEMVKMIDDRIEGKL